MAKRATTRTKARALEWKLSDATPKDEGSYGIRLENVSPVLPPDNEHTNSGVIQMASAVGELARALGASAKALEEIARHSHKAGVYMGNVQISHVGNKPA